jgi:hypothetical protein
VVLTLLLSTTMAQEMVVAPYLQHPTADSVVVRWETTTPGDQTGVTWGTTDALGTSTAGTWQDSSGGDTLHTVELTGLSPGTRYWYRVHTHGLESEIVAFTLPPGPGDTSGVSLLAMSDMQQDPGNPDKFRELIEEGVLPFVEGETGQDIDQALDLVLIPGDLVDWGWSYDEFADSYFAPGARLFERVASYPVPGNHEADSPYFFEYFDLPDNGTEGFEQHWWWADHGNLRVIGLDSNAGYDGATQLDWLDEVLSGACAEVKLDFVLAELHHPALSELWVPGESDFTSEVVSRLETFSTTCGKPSLHLFGHTHGYSRGQSRDHPHLWVNVASAGGNLDYWGEYEQADYDEFTVTLDEYGFSLLDVVAGDDPSLRLRRLSRGDEVTTRDNEVVDELIVYRYGTAPEAPLPRFPVDETVDPACVVLEASPFTDAGGEGHGASHWQLGTSCETWTDLIVDRWVQHENWWWDTDRQASDLLTDDEVLGLLPDTDLCWRVRYRDQGLAWSEWSVGQAFRTGPSSLGDERVQNGGAEDDTTGWTVEEGIFESLADGECGGIAPFAGARYFAVGGVCDSGSTARAVQPLDVSDQALDIDAGDLVAHATAALASWSGNDVAEAQLIFRDADAQELGRGPLLATPGTDWATVDLGAELPTGTRTIDVVLTGTRHSGTDNDSYVDAISVRLGPAGTDCARWDGELPDTEDTEGPDEDPTDGDTGDDGQYPTDGDTGDEEQDPTDETGCGCSASPAHAAWLWLPLLCLVRRAR